MKLAVFQPVDTASNVEELKAISIKGN